MSISPTDMKNFLMVCYVNTPFVYNTLGNWVLPFTLKSELIFFKYPFNSSSLPVISKKFEFIDKMQV